MKSLLAWIGAAALVLWTGAGLVAWTLAKDHVTVVVEPASAAADRLPQEDPLAAVVRRLDELALERRALADALEQNLGLLDERGQARTAELERSLTAQLGDLRRELERLESRAREAARPATPAAEPATVDPAAAAATLEAREDGRADEGRGADEQGEREGQQAVTRRRSFLAFQLPEDDFRFDEARRWTIVPALSRVGFDAKSTLHDFSGTTSEVEGELVLDLSRPAAEPRAEVRVRADLLRTGNDGRDEAMLEHLDVEHHPELGFRLERFEPQDVEPASGTVRGVAHGALRVRGVERAFAMPVRATLDASRRLLLEGEAPLSLPDFDVPVPRKLGLISVDPDVVVWIALRARLEPRQAR